MSTIVDTKLKEAGYTKWPKDVLKGTTNRFYIWIAQSATKRRNAEKKADRSISIGIKHKMI